MTTDPIRTITALRAMQYRTDAGPLLDALEADVRRLTSMLDAITDQRDAAVEQTTAALADVRRLTTERDDDRRRANIHLADLRRVAAERDVRSAEREHAYQVCTKAERERDDARAALRDIAARLTDGRTSGSWVDLVDIARRALGDDPGPVIDHDQHAAAHGHALGEDA